MKRQTPNLLGAESSPYLIGHAMNPVDWRPWGEAAFTEARRRNVPIFLSIGYATCHWCHVMEHESFEDDVVAQMLNDNFVSIKVDREERPDVDAVYMQSVMTMTGRGGWPMSVFLTHDLEPFWGGTYFPKHDRHGMAGFMTILESLSRAWRERRDEVLSSAKRMTQALAPRAAGAPRELDEIALQGGFAAHLANFDSVHGGFGSAPKFPRPHQLSFLLSWWQRSGDQRALSMVEATLDAMAAGGIRDHLGGGFHRYSTDAHWLLPHFEKMLYDQALLLIAYTEAFQATGNERHAVIAREIIEYVLRDLLDPAGGFHSAEDADSEGEEGKFYVFTQKEVRALLDDESARLFEAMYGVDARGNFHDEATGQSSDASILHHPDAPDAIIAALVAKTGLAAPAIHERLARARATLFSARAKRVRPLLDDKVLADWNGLMIAALARAGRALAAPAYIAAARRAAAFVLDTMMIDGRLQHRYRHGAVGIPAFLDDHACMTQALVDLFEATGEARWIIAARAIAGAMIERFSDKEHGGFFLVARDGERLVAESKEIYDGAMPSGNSLAALALLRLGRLLGDAEMSAVGARTLAAFSPQLGAGVSHFPYALLALDYEIGPDEEIVLVGKPGDPEYDAMRRVLDRRLAHRALVIPVLPGAAGDDVRALVPAARGRDAIAGRAAAHHCRGETCALPVTNAPDLLRSLLEFKA